MHKRFATISIVCSIVLILFGIEAENISTFFNWIKIDIALSNISRNQNTMVLTQDLPFAILAEDHNLPIGTEDAIFVDWENRTASSSAWGTIPIPAKVRYIDLNGNKLGTLDVGLPGGSDEIDVYLDSSRSCSFAGVKDYKKEIFPSGYAYTQIWKNNGKGYSSKCDLGTEQ